MSSVTPVARWDFQRKRAIHFGFRRQLGLTRFGLTTGLISRTSSFLRQAIGERTATNCPEPPPVTHIEIGYRNGCTKGRAKLTSLGPYAKFAAYGWANSYGKAAAEGRQVIIPIGFCADPNPPKDILGLGKLGH